MMQEISMNIMDIVQNSIKAHATQVEIFIIENIVNNLFEFLVKDNGKGIEKNLIEKIKDPFFTSRSTRKIGLGVPFVNQMCQMCGGNLNIESEVGIGTTIDATMEYNNIDRPPLGDISSTIQAIIISNPYIDFIYKHIYNNKEFGLSTKDMKEILGDIPFSNPEVSVWIKDYIEQNLLLIRQN